MPVQMTELLFLVAMGVICMVAYRCRFTTRIPSSSVDAIQKFFHRVDGHDGKCLVGLNSFGGTLELLDASGSTTGGTLLSMDVPAQLGRHMFAISLQPTPLSMGDDLTDDDFRRLLTTSLADESMRGVLYQPAVMLALRRLNDLKGGFRVSMDESGLGFLLKRKFSGDDLAMFLAASTVIFQQVCAAGAKLHPELAADFPELSGEGLAPIKFLKMSGEGYSRLGGDRPLDLEQLIDLMETPATLSSESIYDSIGLDMPGPFQKAEAGAHDLPSCEAPTESVDGGDGLQTSRPPVPSVSDL